MCILIIHQNFPGQFKHVAADWAKRPGWQVVGIGRDTAPGMPNVPGLKLIRYKPHRSVPKEQHHDLRKMEDAVLHGQAVSRILLNLRQKGFSPDVILAHPGWGETLYAKDVFPDARLVHLAEWFYNSQGADIGFDPEFPVTFDDRARIRSWNALHLLNLENCDAAISPTRWQKAQHPNAYLNNISVAHGGIDTESLAPDPKACFKLPNGHVIKAGDQVVTYVARNLEPYRGFHSFMRALPHIQSKHRTCHTVIVGGDDVSYGSRPKEARNWREKMLSEVGRKLDPTRTHFLGKVSYSDYKILLQISAAHVYLTYPFVLSWSMLEAMASGCHVIGSNTPPVNELIVDGVNGCLTKILSPTEIAQSSLDTLHGSGTTGQIRVRVRARDQARMYARTRGMHIYEKKIFNLSDTDFDRCEKAKCTQLRPYPMQEMAFV